MDQKEMLQLRATIQQFIQYFGLLEQTTTPCGFSLSISQVFALQELEKATLSVTELAKKLRLERSSVSRLVDSLVKGGFVSREVNEQNRREVILTLTDKGFRSIQRVREQSLLFYQSILEPIREEDQHQILNSFQKFTSALIKVRGD